MTIIYEVNLEVDSSIEEAFLNWLKTHIADMLRIDGFLAATLLKERHSGKSLIWSVRYEVASIEQLEVYFAVQAQSMRQDGIKRFGDLFTASRKILELED